MSALDRCCAVAAAIIETERGDGVSFWRGASEEQRAATREMVVHLLTGGSTSRWVGPEGGARIRRVLVFVAVEYAVPGISPPYTYG